MVRSRQRVTRDAPAGREFAVAAARRESVDAAVAVLDAGGNAVDAAVACGFVAGVVEPSDTCLAGSGLMIVSDPAGADLAVEFPPRAPAAARPGMYEVVSSAGATKLLGVSVVAGDANADGILAPGVPGTIAGLLAAHERLGRLDREQVMAPAIRAAADGFEVDAYLALQALEHLEALRAQPEAAALYLVDGLPPRPAFLGGTTLAVPPRLRQPELARTLEIVAARGAAGFYGGEVAAAIERHFAERGGLLTRADLAAYAPLVGEPLRVRYRDGELLVPRSPCGGWTAAQMLRVLERFAPRTAAEQSPEELHVLAEASAYAFADRYAWLGDPVAVPVPLDGLLSDAYADEIAERIRAGEPAPDLGATASPPWEELAFRALGDPWRHDPRPGRRVDWAPAAPATVAPDGHGTTHFAVTDRDGMTVSCTHTAANAFGSKVVAAGTGVLFDASMVWFNAVPGAANSIAPGRRPLVNMCPLVLTCGGRPRLAIGAPGGRRITSAVVQVLTGVADAGLDVQAAIDAPRIDASGAAVLASERLGAGVLERLRGLGHAVVATREEHEPFLYEFSRPAGVEIAADGTRRAGVDPATVGHAAAG